MSARPTPPALLRQRSRVLFRRLARQAGIGKAQVWPWWMNPKPPPLYSERPQFSETHYSDGIPLR